jgi:hypothetical protein
MIATPKADTLPKDLRKEWEDLMAEKFPMTYAEAYGYAVTRYAGKVSVIAGSAAETCYSSSST